FFSSRRRHTRFSRDWSSDVCSSDLDEVGKRMAVVFIETKTETVTEDDVSVKKTEVIEEVINAATIKEQLGKRFQITGLDSTQERSEERRVGKECRSRGGT